MFPDKCQQHFSFGISKVNISWFLSTQHFKKRKSKDWWARNHDSM